MNLATLSNEYRRQWAGALASFENEPERAAAAFLDRWRHNRLMTAPPGFPEIPEISDEFGWACALELYLLDFAEGTPATGLIFEAIQAADRQLEHSHRGEAWLEDVLALRRLPPLEPPTRWRRSLTDVDLAAAELILNAISSVSRDLPNATRRDFQFFGRMYDAMANALVSEVVEANREGAVWLAYRTGARPLSPTARTLFLDLVPLIRRARERRESPSKYLAFKEDETEFSRVEMLADRWFAQISELVDSISLSNEGLQRLGEDLSHWSAKEREALFHAHRTALARRFDDAFYRLLVADEPGRKTAIGASVETLIGALEAIVRGDPDHISPPVGFTVDQAMVQAEFRGVFAAAEMGDLLEERDDGSIGIDDELADLCGAEW